MSRRHKAKKAGTSVFGIISKVAPYFVFVSQITGKDQATIAAQPTFMGQIQATVNATVGRITGFNPFSKSPVQAKQTLNPSGILNNWTYAGLGGIAYSLLAKHIKVLPMGGKIGSLGKKTAIGAALGGLFDDPTPQTNYITQSYGNSGIVNPQTNSTNYGTLPVVGMRPY